jgi:hypothetical protein
MLRERFEGPDVPEEVALLADPHFRVELTVVEPKGPSRETDAPE